MGLTSVTEAMQASRTFAFPLFMKLSRQFGPEDSAVPKLQAVVYFLGIVLFGMAVSLYSGSHWIGVGAATPLMYADVLGIVQRVQADFLGCALALISLGLLVLAAAKPSRRAPFWILALFVFLAYQTRPAYVFFIGLVPLIGLGLWLLRWGWDLRSLRPWLLRVTLASMVPFLLFSTFRWFSVGHFGLVSYGGINVVGIAATLLDSEVVARLPADVQPVGREIWKTLRMGTRRAKLLQPDNLGGATYRYNKIVWKISYPAAVRVLKRQTSEESGGLAESEIPEPSLTEVNQLLTDLSKAIIRLQPRLYAEWLSSAFASATKRVWWNPWIHRPARWLLWSLPMLLLVEWRWRSRARASGKAASSPPFWWGPLAGLAVLAVGYYTCHLLLIVAVEIPGPRYTVATTIFLPGALVGTLVGVWYRIAYLARLRLR